MTQLAWRVSTFSSSGTSCVALAEAGERVLVRNSTRPEAGTLSLSRAGVAAFVAGCAAGELDEFSA